MMRGGWIGTERARRWSGWLSAELYKVYVGLTMMKNSLVG